MKSKCKNVIIIIGLTLILCNWSYSYWAIKLDNEVKITIIPTTSGEIEYENFNIKAKNDKRSTNKSNRLLFGDR